MRRARVGLVDRDVLTEGVALCAVSGEHLLVGRPRVSPSPRLCVGCPNTLAASTRVPPRRFTEPNELFGPIDLQRLREGVVEVETAGMVPEEQEQNGSLDVDATVVLHPQPDSQAWGSVLTMGGKREVRADSAETAGAFGPFVFPDATERITASLTQITVVRTRASSPSTGSTGRLGTVELEIASGVARWAPA